MLLAQISDIHARADGGDPRHDPVDALIRAVAAINGAAERVDAVLVTGDLIDRDAPLPYEDLMARLDCLDAPWFPIPGNHDIRTDFRTVFGPRVRLEHPRHFLFRHKLDGLTLIGLDSVGPAGEAQLCQERLDWLEATLAEAGQPCFLMLHHPPFALGIPRLDQAPFEGAEVLARIVGAAPSLSGLTCGHAHRASFRVWKGLPATVVPALGHTLALSFDGSVPYGSTSEPPGLMFHSLQSGGIVSHVLTF